MSSHLVDPHMQQSQFGNPGRMLSVRCRPGIEIREASVAIKLRLNSASGNEHSLVLRECSIVCACASCYMRVFVLVCVCFRSLFLSSVLSYCWWPRAPNCCGLIC